MEQGKLGPGWTLDVGSTLCFWDARYFLLRFKKGNSIHWRLSLPDHIQGVLEGLAKTSSTPEEQAGMWPRRGICRVLIHFSAALQQEQRVAEQTQQASSLYIHTRH